MRNPLTFSDFDQIDYHCPQCATGKLIPEKEATIFEPKYSEDVWDVVMEVEARTFRFMTTCCCSNGSCGEIAMISGDKSVTEHNFAGPEGYETEYLEDFRIRSFHPSPYLCEVPPKTPKKVLKRLETSFALFWVDVGAATNALRNCIEDLLTVCEVPDVDDKGNDIWLHDRLELWGKITTASKNFGDLATAVDVLKAVKFLGNEGSHGSQISAEDYVSGLKIFSFVLKELYDNEKDKALALASALLTREAEENAEKKERRDKIKATVQSGIGQTGSSGEVQ